MGIGFTRRSNQIESDWTSTIPNVEAAIYRLETAKIMCNDTMNISRNVDILIKYGVFVERINQLPIASLQFSHRIFQGRFFLPTLKHQGEGL